MIIESIRSDPEWKNGNYTAQPKSARLASIFFQLATNGGNEALNKALPTRAKSDAMLDARLKAPFPGDANDILYQWESTGDYNPAPGLERIQAAVLAINSSDDERYPAELGILEREIRRVKNARVVIILGNEDTAGHGTTGNARWWKRDLDEILKATPRGH
jgi:homoserine O-acetyltransferase